MTQKYIQGEEVSQPYENKEQNFHHKNRRLSNGENRNNAWFFKHIQAPRKVRGEGQIAENSESETDFSSVSEKEEDLFSSCSLEEILV